MNKILHVDNSPAVTGAYKALMSWCLSEPAFEHVWILPDNSTVIDEARKHFTVYTLPFVEIGKSPSKLVRYLPALWANGRKLKRIIEKERPALLHVNDLYNLVPYAAQAFSKRKLPVAVHIRMLRRSFPGKIYDFWKSLHLRKATALIAVSEVIKRDWDNSDRVEVIYDPIDVKEQLPPYKFSRKPDEPFRFLYLANYINGKGQEDALEAVRLLKDQGVDNFRVDFYGGTMGLEKNEAYKRTLEDTVKKGGLAELVTLHEAVTDVEAVMKSYHALLHFSHSESFGMVCYEGLYYGLPTISSDCGGPAEMMEPGKSGFLLPVGAVKEFAASMKSLIEDPQQCASLSAEAAEYIRHKFMGSAPQLSATFAALTHESS